ncbi:YnfC family lipoprotein (plasmid) [Pantoea agglomerans]
MKARLLLSLLLLAMSFNVAAFTQFKPAVLNAALLFEHDATTGNVKHSLQWIRDIYGKLQAMTEVRYDRNGCFTNINMVDKANGHEFHLVNKDGVLTSLKVRVLPEKSMNAAKSLSLRMKKAIMYSAIMCADCLKQSRTKTRAKL